MRRTFGVASGHLASPNRLINADMTAIKIYVAFQDRGISSFESLGTFELRNSCDYVFHVSNPGSDYKS